MNRLKVVRLALAVCALCATVAVSLGPVGAKSSGASIVVRSSRVQFDIGDRIDWTIDWTKLAAGTSAEQVVVDLDGQHEFIEGSVEAPHGWTVEFSEDGETYSDSSRGFIRFLRFSNDEVSSGGTRVSVPIARPIPPIVTAANGGDGYIPMLAGDRVFAIWHHLPATGSPAASVVCIDTVTGKGCPGYPKLLGMQTSFNQGGGVYVNRKLFFKNRDATTHGVMCWDTVTDNSCGYVPIATLGPVTGGGGGNGGFDQFSSPVVYDGRMYFAAQNHRVYCFDPETSAICDDYTLAGKAMARGGETHVTTVRPNDIISHDGRLYFSLANSWPSWAPALGTKIECFDLETNAPCVGFGNAGVVSENQGTTYMFTRYDALGAPIGFCMGAQLNAKLRPAQGSIPCYDFDGSNRTLITSTVAFAQRQLFAIEEATIGTRTFFGHHDLNGGYCYDWSTSAPCAGANFNADGVATKTTAEEFYGFVKRGRCAIGLGHKGIFMSVDPLTGASPCLQIDDSSFVAAAETRYCRDTKYLDGWSGVRTTDVNAPDFSKLDIVVSDGTTRESGDLLAGPVDLSTMNSTDPLAVRVTASLLPSADPWKSATPAVEFFLKGSNQFCFQTVAKPMPTTETDLVVDVITDEGKSRRMVAPDPVLLKTGALLTELPATGNDALSPTLWALSVIAGGLGARSYRRRRVARR